MELFDKKFVCFMWDVTLSGKQVFVADSVVELKDMVNAASDSNRHRIRVSNDSRYPFLSATDNIIYTFVYYDPLYDYKVVYSKGEKIEYRLKSSNTEWALTKEPIWDDERYEYRVKSNEIAANREVLEWLAKGNGVVKAYQNTVTISFCISEEDMNKPCMHKVCKWGDGEWHDATHEYLGIKE